jgi:hypothetical protein
MVLFAIPIITGVIGGIAYKLIHRANNQGTNQNAQTDSHENNR